MVLGFFSLGYLWVNINLYLQAKNFLWHVVFTFLYLARAIYLYCLTITAVSEWYLDLGQILVDVINWSLTTDQTGIVIILYIKQGRHFLVYLRKLFQNWGQYSRTALRLILGKIWHKEYLVLAQYYRKLTSIQEQFS